MTLYWSINARKKNTVVTIMLNLIVALKCEANHLIQYYGLKHVSGKSSFPVYENDDIVLIISGPGKVASAAATAFLYAQTGQQTNCGWLNLGIAGHKARAIGEGVLVHKITDYASKKSWYPSIVFTPKCESDNLVTVDQVEERYAENTIYEMEASGFYDIASRFSTVELIHCYKIISDNKLNSVSKISEKFVSELMFSNMEIINSLVQEITAISAALKSLNKVSPGFEEINGRWHFSTYQKGELRRLLKRWELLACNSTCNSDCDSENEEMSVIPLLKQCRNSKGVLSLLENVVTAQVFRTKV